MAMTGENAGTRWIVGVIGFYPHLFLSSFLTPGNTLSSPEHPGFALMLTTEEVPMREKIIVKANSFPPHRDWTIQVQLDFMVRPALPFLYTFKTSLSWDLSFHRDWYSAGDPADV